MVKSGIVEWVAECVKQAATAATESTPLSAAPKKWPVPLHTVSTNAAAEAAKSRTTAETAPV